MIKGIDEDKLTEAIESFMALLPEFIQLALEFKTNSTNIKAHKARYSSNCMMILCFQPLDYYLIFINHFNYCTYTPQQNN